MIENTQRDLNIALVNELAIIFQKLAIDSIEVLEAAGTKWNFMPFRPGLVGGHCIGVDPYYLTFKAEQVGYNPQVILAGTINDGMAAGLLRNCSLNGTKNIPIVLKYLCSISPLRKITGYKKYKVVGLVMNLKIIIQMFLWLIHAYWRRSISWS